MNKGLVIAATYFLQIETVTSDICSSRPCLHGVCHRNGVDDYLCDCDVGYTGDRCDKVNPCLWEPCENGGDCSLGGDGTVRCDCPHGYTGDYCQFSVALEKESLKTSSSSSSSRVRMGQEEQDAIIIAVTICTLVVLAILFFAMLVLQERRRLRERFQSAIELGVNDAEADFSWMKATRNVFSNGIKQCKGWMWQDPEEKERILNYLTMEQREPGQEDEGMPLTEEELTALRRLSVASRRASKASLQGHRPSMAKRGSLAQNRRESLRRMSMPASFGQDRRLSSAAARRNTIAHHRRASEVRRGSMMTERRGSSLRDAYLQDKRDSILRRGSTQRRGTSYVQQGDDVTRRMSQQAARESVQRRMSAAMKRGSIAPETEPLLVQGSDGEDYIELPGNTVGVASRRQSLAEHDQERRGSARGRSQSLKDDRRLSYMESQSSPRHEIDLESVGSEPLYDMAGSGSPRRISYQQ